MKGPKPGTLRQGSLASKLAQLRPGEWLCLPDDGQGDKASALERTVQTVLFRSPALEGYGITTERVLIVGQGFTSSRALRIARHH